MKFVETPENTRGALDSPHRSAATGKTVSIIIPTFNDWTGLQNCVNAIEGQTYSKSLLELIIVNNNPSDAMPEDFRLPGFGTIISEAKTGSYAARNTGLKLAKGEIIGFTDADCLPANDWIEKAVEYLEKHPSCSRLAGSISVIQRSAAPTAIEVYNKLYSFPQKASVEHYSGGMTANLFTYRHVFEKVGPFNETFLSFGDQEWGSRARSQGFEVHYVEEVVIFHPPRSWNELLKRERRLGGGTALLRKNTMSTWQQIKECIKILRPRTRGLKTMLRHSHQYSWRHILLVPLISYYLDLIRYAEIVRIMIGKKPNRS